MRLAALLLVACTSSVPVRNVPHRTVAYCFDLTVEARAGRVCLETAWLCSRASEAAQRYGAMGGVTAVTTCTRRTNDR